MLNRMLAVAAACVLAGCATEDLSRADIANVANVKSSFGPEFKVSTVGPTGVDPKVLAPQPMPPGVKFEPADCAKFAQAQVLPEGLKGNMAATTAEGQGNRYITMAVETSEPVPLNEPGEECQKVGFASGATRGMVEVVESPQIDGTRTLATHRVVQTTVDGKPHTGELYNYVASFGTFLVIVTANPLAVPGKPVAPVNTQRARDLLTAAVAAVKG
ncbi:DUF5642 family protein [Mycobacterium hubeiense]|uniref:DUF5642 family protein n=1 Tax=Mycobacterium hubeiense TaxID=1867256 RepID=UPI000C7E9488|nr:DUF5642 family protein [Mycobacterium sp. QGD 101]